MRPAHNVSVGLYLPEKPDKVIELCYHNDYNIFEGEKSVTIGGLKVEFLKIGNLGVRFILEILALVIYGYWGFHVSNGIFLKIVLGIGTPLLAAFIWGTFGAPQAPYLLTGGAYLLLEIAIFGLAVVALYTAGKQSMAITYGIITIINLVLMKIWDQ